MGSPGCGPGNVPDQKKLEARHFSSCCSTSCTFYPCSCQTTRGGWRHLPLDAGQESNIWKPNFQEISPSGREEHDPILLQLNISSCRVRRCSWIIHPVNCDSSTVLQTLVLCYKRCW